MLADRVCLGEAQPAGALHANTDNLDVTVSSGTWQIFLAEAQGAENVVNAFGIVTKKSDWCLMPSSEMANSTSDISHAVHDTIGSNFEFNLI